jgi:hypothetical protein
MARLLAEVPDKEHKYLKMCCAQLGVTMRSFITAAIIEKVEKQEDEWLLADIEQDSLFEKYDNGEMQFIMWDDYIKQSKEEIASVSN